MDGVLRRISVLFGLAVTAAAPAHTQEALHPVYLEHLRAATTLQPLGDAPFGERIDLHTGEVRFHQADVVLVGTGPTIRIARMRPATGTVHGPAMAFGDWLLDLPRIETRVAASGDMPPGQAWRLHAAVDADSLARCSGFAPPYAGDAGLSRDAWWNGYALQLGDGQAQALLQRAPAWTVRPGLPGPFPAVTTSDVHVGCLAGTANGEAGEGFLAVAPDGTRYRFDWLVASDGGTVEGVQDTLHAAMLVTRIEDRFGNRVDFAYDGARLRTIQASDGRAVELEWNGDLLVRITTHPGSEAPRTWRYTYSGRRLTEVVLPDNSRWSFDLASGPAPGNLSTLTAPSGLVGRFLHEPAGRALAQRTWSGPGVDMQWTYSRGTATDARWMEVVAGDGTRVRHTTAATRDALEGKPLQTETYDAEGALLRTERFRYMTSDAAPFVARIGDAMRGSVIHAAPLETRVPLRERVITQQGVDFRWRVTDDCNTAPCFDQWARPLVVERAGTHRRIDRTTYADNIALWVLGQVASESTFDPAAGTDIETLRIDHDPVTALPLRRHVRGLLQDTRTYHRDGNLATQSDGRDSPGFDTTIRYSGWMRGIPGRVSFPGGVRTSAGVEVDGTIRWVSGETGARTCHDYDAVGRLVRTTWPSESQPSRCDTGHWNATTAQFEQVPTPHALLGAHHWRHTEQTGNGVRRTWHDALWRPVLVEEHDAGNVTNTRRSVRRAYDAAGRATFVSYPSSLEVPPLAGVSTRHDALGRAVRVERTSELGALVSSVEHLDEFRIRATNPRGHATLAQLRAFDMPEAHWVDGIAYPDGLHVDIARNLLGEPTRITQRTADSTLSTTDHAVYDAHGRLCKTIATASGATVIARDVMGNVTWTVEGTSLDDTADCQLAAAHASGRRVDRTWDARGRLATVAYPDGIGNQAWTYTADGRPSRVTTYNTRAGAVVFNGYEWNARRLLVNEWVNRLGYSWHLYTAYDRNGHPATLTYPNTTAVGLVPDALGRPTRLGNYVTGVRWHPDGTIARFAFGNGIVHTATPNARGLPERRGDTYGSTVFHDESLDYDANGNLAGTSDALPGARGDRLLQYDALDRLVQVDSPLFGVARYDHDPLGRPAKTSIGGPHARTHAFCRDARGLVTNVKTIDCAGGPSVIGIAHDAAGNLVRLNAQDYAYDFGHRLRAVAGVESYEYDGPGRRVRAVSAGGEVLSQYAIDGRLMWQVDAGEGRSKLHLYLGDRLVGVREQPLTGGAATIRYLHTDPSGTPVAETGPDRTLLRRNLYEPHGLLLDPPAIAGVGFLGHAMDDRTGLRYAPSGYFHPVLPDALAACGWKHHMRIWDASADLSSVLRAATRLRC